LPERSANLAGIALMLVAMFFFSMNDALGKWLVATYSVAQLLFIRSAAAGVMLMPFALKAGTEPFRTAPRPFLQLLRVVLATVDTGLFYLAVWHLPLADAMTYYLAGPIYVTALSALILKEPVGAYRWSAILVGFVGVVIAMQPTSGSLTPGAIIAFCGSISYALLMVVTRQLRATHHVVLASTQTIGAFILGAAGLPFATRAVGGIDLLLLLLLGVVSIGSIVLVNQSLRLAPASIVVPFQYSLIVWAMLFGYLVFGDVPHWHTLIGAAIIVASGLFIFLREQHLGVPGAEEPALAEK
jgi:drug/metabolite transporter (DMT)-like permease